MTNIPPKIQPYKRAAWKPIVIDGDGALTASKFAGKPWLAKDEQWPKCRCCQEPLQFFLQLNLNQLPEALRNEFCTGILQMFYCTNIDSECDADYVKMEGIFRCSFYQDYSPRRKKKKCKTS